MGKSSRSGSFTIGPGEFCTVIPSSYALLPNGLHLAQFEPVRRPSRFAHHGIGQPAGILHGSARHNSVHYAERRGREPDSQGERNDANNGRARTADQLPPGEKEVAQRTSQRLSARRVPPITC